MDHTIAIYLFILFTPHIAIGLAWIFWSLSPVRFQPPKWRSIAAFLALLAGSLNIVIYWCYIAWLQRHFTTESWKGRDFAFNICQFLIGWTIIGALFGKGRVRVTLFIAGILGFFLWVTIAHGVL
jgi:hypothetical protein